MGLRERSLQLHLARTTTRKAKREACRLADVEVVNSHALNYLNRLSDLLFVLSRYVNIKGASDVLWTLRVISEW